MANDSLHPAVKLVGRRIRDDLVGGAADMAREAAAAMAQAARVSKAATTAGYTAEFKRAARAILEVSLSIAPVTNLLHQLGAEAEGAAPDAPSAAVRERVAARAASFGEKLSKALQKIAEIGAATIRDGDKLFMYSMSSTVWRMIRAAHRQGKRVSVAVTESRPANEGLWSLTELTQDGIPVTVGIDAAIGVLVPGSAMVLVGGDTITAAGDAICKVGTFPTALVAQHYGIPLRLAADLTKFDPSTLDGMQPRLREMGPKGVLPAGVGSHTTVRNPIFEIVPAALIKDIITERGILHPAMAATMMREQPHSKLVAEIMAAIATPA